MRSAPAARGLLGRFFREHLRPYLPLQVEIAFCLAVGVLLELADPLILKALIDRALGDGDASLLWILVAALGAVLLFRVAFRLLSVWLTSYSGLRVLFDLRQRAFEHLSRLSPSFLAGERQGDLLARLTADIDVLQRAAAHTLVNLAHDLLVLAGIAGLLFWLEPRLALGMLALYPPLVVALVLLNRRLRDEGQRARGAVGGLYDFLEERLGAMQVVQEFRRERAEARRHVRASRPWIGSNLALSFLGATQVSIADLMGTGATMVVFLAGGTMVLEGRLGVGALVAFTALAQRLWRPINGLIDVNVDLQVARASLARVYELLDTPAAIREHPEATLPARVPPAGGELVLEGARLSWDGGDRGVAGIDLCVGPGEVVALVGPSGGGKSTIAALAARYLDPQGGQVRLDGLDLTRWRLRELRRAVGLVAQHTRLFHDTIEGNLRFAAPRASQARLRAVLAEVELAELVERLPDGLVTTVGEGGLALSGGERQRLALARALLAEPRVLVLDEATSALDALTEARVLGRLLDRAAGRTLLVIAHRLGPLSGADRIAVVAGGRIVEAGSHGELLAAGGLYRRLWDEQARADGRPGRAAPAPAVDSGAP